MSSDQADNESEGGTRSNITNSELKKRELAIRFANASIRLEGFAVSAGTEATDRDFIEGRIDLQEFLRRTLDEASLKAAPPEK